MPHYTERQIDLLNRDPLVVTRIDNLEFKLIKRPNGEFLAGTIINQASGERVVVELQRTRDIDEGWDAWQSQVRSEVDLRTDSGLTSITEFAL
jgi:hypothetical protein